ARRRAVARVSGCRVGEAAWGYISEPTCKISAEAVAKMAARNKSKRTGEAAWAVQGDRYLQRLLDDEELRSRLLGAYTAARSAYGRLSNGKSSTHALFEDPKLQQELIDAASALRDA